MECTWEAINAILLNTFVKAAQRIQMSMLWRLQGDRKKQKNFQRKSNLARKKFSKKKKVTMAVMRRVMLIVREQSMSEVEIVDAGVLSMDKNAHVHLSFNMDTEGYLGIFQHLTSILIQTHLLPIFCAQSSL